MRFYKYKSLEKIEYIIDMIENNRLYMPRTLELNDPLEGICKMNFGFAGCSYYHGTGTIHPCYCNTLNTYRVLALASRKDSVVMWAHYADEFKGICVEFENNAASLQEAKPVIYTDERIDSKVFEGSFDELAYNALQRKALEWSYEEEYRIIKKIDETDEYINLLPNEIKCIYIGYMVPKTIKMFLADWCRYHNIETRIMFVNPYRYALEDVSLKDYLEKCNEYDGTMYKCG